MNQKVLQVQRVQRGSKRFEGFGRFKGFTVERFERLQRFKRLALADVIEWFDGIKRCGRLEGCKLPE